MSDAPFIPPSEPHRSPEGATPSAPDGEARLEAVRALRVALQLAGRIARGGGLTSALHAVEAAELALLEEVGLDAFTACTARTFQPSCAAGLRPDPDGPDDRGREVPEEGEARCPRRRDRSAVRLPRGRAGTPGADGRGPGEAERAQHRGWPDRPQA